MSSNTKSELSNRIVGSKAWLVWIWLTAGIVCLSDIAVLVVLGIEGVQGAVYALPIVFLVLDVIITFLSAVTNFRFKRALVAPIVYAVLKLAIVVLAMGLFLGDTIIFSTTAITLWLVFEFLSIVCIILSAVFAKGSGHAFLAVVAVFTVAIIAFGVVYMLFVSTNGFFGQNKEHTFEKRTLVYTYYDDNKDSLTVSDVLDGNGTIVVVPDEFNGLPVKGIDCEIFSVEDVDTVVLYCDESVEFLNTSALSYFNDEISLYADEGFVSSCRNQFYQAAATSSRMGERYTAFANSIVPLVDDDSVYVSIDVDYRVLSTLYEDSEIPDVWVASKGETFDLADYGFEYMSHMDVEDEDDLYWCYNSFNQYILTDLTDSDGESVIGAKITSSVNITMDLEEVYAISIAEGNDAMYSEAEYGLTLSYDGTYHYVTNATADSIIGEVASRTGFSFEWQNGSARTLSSLNGNMSDKMTIYPVWTLHDPKITSIGTTNSSGTSTSEFTYGNTINFASGADHEVEDIKLSYKWTYGGESQAIESSFTIDGAYPSRSGTYTLTVTAGDDDITSLTASSSQDIGVTVSKRNLVLEWSTNSETNLVYSGSDVTVSVTTDAGTSEGNTGTINSDEVTFIPSRTTIRDAGTYTISALLDSDWTSLYQISGDKSYTFEITPYSLTVSWTEPTFTYNAEKQCPKYSYLDGDGNEITVLGEDTLEDVLVITESDVGKDAGYHIVELSNTNTNYTLVEGSTSYSYYIAQKNVYVTWGETTSFTYNGGAQYPTASTDDIEESDVLAGVSLTYSGYGTDVDTYTVKLGISSGNYVLATKSGYGALEYTYTISQKQVELIWDSNTTFTYDSHEHSITAAFASGSIVDGDSGGVALTYSGDDGSTYVDTYTVKDAKTYAITAYLTGERAGNYVILNSTQTYKVEKKPFNISAKSLSKEYDGTAYTDEETYTCGDVADNDSLSDVVGISVTYCSGSSPVNVGTYKVAITLTEGEKYSNYSITSSLTGEIVITARKLTISGNTLTKTYDGTAYEENALYTWSGLASTDSLEEVVTVAVSYDSGSAPKDANAKIYIFTLSESAQGEKHGNYSISYSSGSITITPKTLSVSWSDVGPYEYDGQSHTPVYTVEGYVNGESGKFTVAYYGAAATDLGGAPTDAGTYRIELTLSDSNYTTGSSVLTREFTISPKNITLTYVDWSATTKTYDGTEFKPTATITLSESIGYSLSYKYTYAAGEETDPVNAGTYQVTVTVTPTSSNYTIGNNTSTLEFTIMKATLTITWTTGENTTPTAEVIGVVREQNVSVTYTYFSADGAYLGSTAPTDAGSYRVVITLTYSNGANADNYTVSGETEKYYTITDANGAGEGENN